MTEAEWLECTNPQAMLEFLSGQVSDRKLRLFAVACCRRIWASFSDERSRRGVEIAERFADEKATLAELDEACVSARRAAWDVYWDVCRQAAWATTWRLMFSDTTDDHEQDSAVTRAIEFASREASRSGKPDATAVECQEQAALLREIVGNPFRPVSVDTNWLTPNVVHLAQSIYEQRAFERMPELAITLEQAGCAGRDILEHCRRQKNHARGCWLLDLLLRKK